MTWPRALRRLRPFFSSQPGVHLTSVPGAVGLGSPSPAGVQLTRPLTALQSLSLACGEICPHETSVNKFQCLGPEKQLLNRDQARTTQSSSNSTVAHREGEGALLGSSEPAPGSDERLESLCHLVPTGNLSRVSLCLILLEKLPPNRADRSK